MASQDSSPGHEDRVNTKLYTSDNDYGGKSGRGTDNSFSAVVSHLRLQEMGTIYSGVVMLH